jgi:GDPmannose 4,6-dehydratase
MDKTVFITGITGQDGSYLAEFLLEKGYRVVGLIRRTSTTNLTNIENILEAIHLEYGDLTDQSCLDRIVRMYEPDEIYNLAAMSFVPVSWDSAEYTFNVNTLGTVRLLESMKKYRPDGKFYQASTSEMFGKVVETPQDENTPFYPRSPYGVAKVAAHYATINYKESFNLHATSGILFNHESPRRGLEFVTRKITNGVAKIKLGLQDYLYLGNLESKRDWGHSKDYVRAMWLMLQQNKPDTYVVGSGKAVSVRDFCKYAFDYVNMNYRDYVKIDERFYRPAEVDILLANPNKAKMVLGWEPEYSISDLIYEMVDNDLGLLKR